jgi:hypothetical protein
MRPVFWDELVFYAVDLISRIEKELSEICSILTGNSRDQSSFASVDTPMGSRLGRPPYSTGYWCPTS